MPPFARGSPNCHALALELRKIEKDLRVLRWRWCPFCALRSSSPRTCSGRVSSSSTSGRRVGSNGAWSWSWSWSCGLRGSFDDNNSGNSADEGEDSWDTGTPWWERDTGAGSDRDRDTDNPWDDSSQTKYASQGRAHLSELVIRHLVYCRQQQRTWPGGFWGVPLRTCSMSMQVLPEQKSEQLLSYGTRAFFC